MKILLITQEDLFYLPEALRFFLKKLPDDHQVVAACVTNVSPFGRKEPFHHKVLKTLKIFGLRFFLYYCVRYILAKYWKKASVSNTLNCFGVPIIRPTLSLNHPNTLNVLRSYEPDLIISVAGNEIFRKELIGLAPRGCLNLHTGKLPRYRGLMPSFWAMNNLETEIGVSVFFVDEGIDSGPILVQKTIPIMDLSQAQVIRLTKNIGMEALIEAVEMIHLDTVSLKENNDDDSTYFGFPTRNDVKNFYREGKRFF